MSLRVGVDTGGTFTDLVAFAADVCTWSGAFGHGTALVP
jgi:N-methylhydantoinase A/oxoprolinase/acetone carboxylase beta subunit